MTFNQTIARTAFGRALAVLAMLTLALSGCVQRYERHEYQREAISDPPPRPVTQVLFYPAQGQTPEQQNRDRYECYSWAVAQTGFDPSQPALAPQQRIEVVPSQREGHDTAVGAVAGAILGAAVSRPRQAAGGAILGAVAGAMVGAASDSARQEETDRVQRRYDVRDAQASNYRRAMTACLEGRGYTVK